MLDNCHQIGINATMARGPLYVSTVISYSLSYDIAIVMDNDNLVTALSTPTQISVSLIGMVRNHQKS